MLGPSCSDGVVELLGYIWMGTMSLGYATKRIADVQCCLSTSVGELGHRRSGRQLVLDVDDNIISTRNMVQDQNHVEGCDKHRTPS
jgi:hypothetical protein